MTTMKQRYSQITGAVTGNIKVIKKVEGYGFITRTSNGKDYFFHKSAVRYDVPFEKLEPHMPVEFIAVEDGPKGPKAVAFWVVESEV
jgi:cold shock CspA family protein